MLEGLYPPESAQSWDQVGLVSGDPAQPVSRIHFAVDPTLAVIEEARALGADLVVTHHPLLLRGIHSVATTGAKGASVTALVVHDIALYVAHTNADVAQPGVNDALAAGVRPRRHRAAGRGRGAGPRPGRRPRRPGAAGRLRPAPCCRAARRRRAGCGSAGPPDAVVRRVAVMGGAGDDMFDHVRRSGADVYVTADLRHHPVLEAREEARGGPPYLVDAGHWATESLWLAGAAARVLEGSGGRAGSSPLGWRPTSQHCAPTPGTSWSVPRRPRPQLAPEVRPESRPVPSVAPARPAGDRHSARPDRPRPSHACRSWPRWPALQQKVERARQPAGAGPHRAR